MKISYLISGKIGILSPSPSPVEARQASVGALPTSAAPTRNPAIIMAEGSSTAMEIDDAPEMSHKQKTREAQIASLPWVEKCASAMCSSLRPLCTHLGAASIRAGTVPRTWPTSCRTRTSSRLSLV